MINYECNAALRFKMTSDAKNDAQIINLADAISEQRFGERMDSLDLGDSMGIFIRCCIEDFYSGELNSVFIGDGFYVNIDCDWELFQWNRGLNPYLS